MRSYIKLVSDIPEVREVRLLDDDEGPALWTIISATPFDNGPRDRVIEAQIDVMRSMEEPLLGFRLINIRELNEEFSEEYISDIGTIAWSR